MKKMKKIDNWGRMSTTYPLLNSDLPLTRPLRAYRNMVYTFAVFAMLLSGGWNTQAFAAWSGNGSGEEHDGKWYVYYNTTSTINMEYSVGKNSSGVYSSELALLGPGKSLFYEYALGKSATYEHYVTAEYYTNSWNALNQKTTKSNSYSNNGTETWSSNYPSKIRFKRTAYLTGGQTMQVKNIKVEMAQYIENPSETSLAFGSGKVDDANTTKTFTIAWCNVPVMTNSVSGSGSDQISVEIENNSSYGNYNTATVKVTYNRNAASTLNATLTISDEYGSYSKNISLTGSTAKYDQTITWSNKESIPENLMVGATPSITASTDSGLDITYTSSNTSALTVSSTGQMSAIAVGTATITLSQAGNYKFNAAPNVTKTFTVKTKDTPIFTPDGFTHESTKDIYVGDVLTLNLTNVSDGLSGDFKVTYDSHYFNVTRAGNTLSIEALNAGNGKTVVVSQTENTTIFGLSRTYTFNISKIANTLDVTTATYEMFVDEELGGIINSGGAITGRNNNDEAVNVSSTDDGVLYYDATNDKVVANNNANEMFGASKVVTLTFSQPETYKYEGASKTIEVTVKKYANTIYVKGSTDYSSSIYTDSYDNEIIVTATNTDYVGSPISCEQTVGEDIATYSYNQSTHSGDVSSNYKLGTATWTVSQPENYKYQSGSGSFTVNVIQQPEATDCYVLNYPDEKDFGTYGPTSSYEVNGPADKLYFKAKKNGYNYFVAEYSTDNGNSWHEICAPDLTGDYPTNDYGPFTIPEKNITHIRFGAKVGATLHKWVKDVKITRKTYLTASDITVDTQSDNVTPVYLGDRDDYVGTGTLVINRSLASGGDLKVKFGINPDDTDPQGNYKKFKFVTYPDCGYTVTDNEVTITGVDCATGVTNIHVEYTSTSAGTDNAQVVIYNDAYNITANITGEVVKHEQVIQWKPNFEKIRIGEDVTDAAQASQGAVTYASSDETVIRVDNDGTTLHAMPGQSGHSATITAIAAETPEYVSTSISKSITVTDKQIQYIVWTQSLLNLKVGGSNKVLTAYVSSDIDGCNTNGSRLVTYSSDNESVVKVVNTNQLQIVGKGAATITATQAGEIDGDGHNYEEAVATKRVIVRDPDDPCEDYVYDEESEYEFFVMNVSQKLNSPEYPLDGEPAYLSCEVKREYYTFAINYSSGGISIMQYIPDEGWSTVRDISESEMPIGQYNTLTNIPLDRRATKIKYFRDKGPTGHHYIKNVKITRARYIEKVDELVDFHANVGEIQTQTQTINYSSLTDNLTITMGQGENSHFTVNGATSSEIAGDCGSYAKNVPLTITYNPTIETDNETETMTITDGTTTLTVLLTGSATRVNRTISWDQEVPDPLYTVQSVTMNAQALTAQKAEAGAVAYAMDNENSTTGSLAGNVLSFNSIGVATVIASTVEDVKYNPATPVKKRFNVSLTPTSITSLPTIGDVTGGTTFADATAALVGGQATNTVNSEVVAGTIAITAGNLTDIGEQTVTLTFTPDNTDMYAGCTSTMTVTVVKRDIQEGEAEVNVGTITYGQKISEASLTNAGTLEGTWAWTDADKENTPDAGTVENLEVTFTPASGNVNSTTKQVSLTVNKATPVLSWTVAPTALEYNAAGTVYSASSVSDGAIRYSIVSENTYAGIDEETGELTIRVPGQTVTVQAAQAEGTNYLAPEAITVDVTIGAAPLVNIFTNAAGDGDWKNAYNWESGVVPTGDPDVIVTGDLAINEDITVGSLTIENTGSVAVIASGSITVQEASAARSEYGSLTVGGKGELIANARINVSNFLIETYIADKLIDETPVQAQSGQVTNLNNITANGDVLFTVHLDPSGVASEGWYAFAVPFEVDAQTSVYDRAGNRLTYGREYAIAAYNGAKRAQGQRGWDYERTILRPGVFYMITVSDESYSTLVFHKKAGAALANGNTALALNEYALNGGQAGDQGWNGLANNQFHYVNLSTTTTDKVQVYHHHTNSFEAISIQDNSFVVASPFFVQASGSGQTLVLEDASHAILYAPSRNGTVQREFCVRLGKNEQSYSDQLFLSADTEAKDEYEAGQDLQKATAMAGAAKVAQMSISGYGMQLCDAAFPLADNGTALFPLNLTSPKAQSLQLYVEQGVADQTLYLTYEGVPVWNLSESAYTMDLVRGNTTGYGLMLMTRQHQQPTGTHEAEQTTVQAEKMIINGVLYILHEGVLYDMNGKRVQKQ